MAIVRPEVRLDDKYLATSGKIFLSGVQALVRLPIIQRLRDLRAGHNTAGFISGYRGAPLAGFDKAIWGAQALLDEHHVRFWPALNEELAASAVWGTQQIEQTGHSRYAGVFAMWYGKGLGVDRCGAVFQHMNHAGTTRLGGVLLVAGDDHGAYASTLAHQSDHQFAAAMIPLLYPCNVEEYLTLGLHGWAMSRFSGLAVGIKALADTADSSASIAADPFAIETHVPAYPSLPLGGLNVRLSPASLSRQAREQEALLHDYKIYAALAYARANHLNELVWNPPRARLGVIASGKSYVDVVKALDELGIDGYEAAARIGIRLFKVAMPWPLEPESVRELAAGLEEILVIEEKRQVIEYQVKEQLYNLPDSERPRVIGKFDEKGEWVSPRGEWLLPPKGDFSIAQIARVLAGRISRFHRSDTIAARVAFLEAKEAAIDRGFRAPPRPPYYCAGCPHNRSTRTPVGSVAVGGIGCHVLAPEIFPESNRTIAPMGGEGATWIGQAAFSDREHMFANLGDGTYFHSGSLAIRAAVAAGVNVTFKILYNDAVAMTGGQPIDGKLTVADMVRQIAAEGVKRIIIVAEDPNRHFIDMSLRGLADVYKRSQLDAVQRELREYCGVSVLINDQTCAAEKRRRRKRAEYPQPVRRAFINTAVCEGCGDCGRISNCVAIKPVETPFGRKRAIDQETCNNDLTCIEGFCPAFVYVEGDVAVRGRGPVDLSSIPEDPAFDLPAPPPSPELTRPYNILIAGIGGNGVTTISAILGMAAHLEDRDISVLDLTGISQKNGAVTAHVRIGGGRRRLRAQRIAAGEADLLLAYDLLTAGEADTLRRTDGERTRAVVNTYEQPAGTFAQDRDWVYPRQQVEAVLRAAVADRYSGIDSTALAEQLLGSAMAGNFLLLGYAWQLGAIPLGLDAIERAIELNNVEVALNLRAFRLGRRQAAGGIVRMPTPAVASEAAPRTLDDRLGMLMAYLRDYQDEAYARHFRALVDDVRAKDEACGRDLLLTRTVADYFARLLAYKDEYEVARLFTDGEFEQQLRQAFGSVPEFRYSLAPPRIALTDDWGKINKIEFGRWLTPVLRVLKHLKFLRGTRFDPFGHTSDRRLERQLCTAFETSIRAALPRLTPDTYDQCVELARASDGIRGYGYVKLTGAREALVRWHAAERALGIITLDVTVPGDPIASADEAAAAAVAALRD